MGACRPSKKSRVMIHKIRPYRSTLLAVLCCGVSAVSALAQGPGQPPPGGPGEPHHHGPPPSPLFDALDTNHDGVISADEIAKASDSLKALLKPGANQLTREDVRPLPPPPHPHDGGDAASAEGDHPHPRPEGVRPHNPPPMPDEATADADGADGKHGPREDGEDHRGHHGPPEDGEGRRGHHGPPPSPVFDALDANHDGVISADEMNNATASLKGLLKPGTSELRREDVRPERGPRGHED